MSLTRDNFSRRYAVRLQEYLGTGSRAVLRRAVILGRQAVKLGLETLELAQIHLGALGETQVAAGLQRRAQCFFNEVQTSLVERQLVVCQVYQQVDKLEGRLKVRRGQLAEAQVRLQAGILERRSLELKLRRAGRDFAQLRQTSAKSEASLKHLAHELMLAHEEQRRMVRRQLQDEIGQSLLGIGIQLFNLKQAVAGNESNFLNEIATAEDLVVKCLKAEVPAVPA